MYTLTERQIPFIDTYDVIVFGGGPSGCARLGVKTLLIEKFGNLGGMGTTGLVPFWCGFSNGGDLCCNGIAKEVLHASNKMIFHMADDAKNGQIDPEALKIVYDDLVTESGADILFNSTYSSLDTDGNGSIKAVIVSDKRGMTAYSAKIYIDCTGDADLAADAGANFIKGGEIGDMAPATLCFTLTNVDMYEYIYMCQLHPEFCGKIAHCDPEFPLIIDNHSPHVPVGPGAVGLNAGHIHDVDPTDPVSVSAALLKGRKLAMQIRDELARDYPKIFGNAFLAQTAQQMDARESRRVKGDYMLTKEDYYARAVFPDEIARNCYNLDSHSSRHEIALAKEGKLGYNAEDWPLKPGESHGIPYRCLTPMGLKNVLVAGRSISADRRTMGSIRVMAPCLSTGEAAGIAAALAVKTNNYDVHTLDVKAIRDRIIEQGGYIL